MPRTSGGGGVSPRLVWSDTLRCATSARDPFPAYLEISSPLPPRDFTFGFVRLRVRRQEVVVHNLLVAENAKLSLIASWFEKCVSYGVTADAPQWPSLTNAVIQSNLC